MKSKKQKKKKAPKKQKKLSPYKRSQLKEAIIRARCRYVTRHPFWGMLGMRIPLVETDQVPTAGTDGRRILYNPVWLTSIYEDDLKYADEYIQFVVAHELYHLILDTAGRQGGRDKTLWNMATDYIINRDLKEEFQFAPKEVLWNKNFHDPKIWYAERVYEYIEQNSTKISANLFKIKMPDGTNEEVGPWHDDLEMYPGETQQEKDEAALEWKATAVKSLQAAKMQGHSHGYMQRLIDEILNPKLPWRALLSDFVTTFARDDYSYEKLDPTYLQSDILMPSLFNVSLTGVVTVDTSGSISTEEAKEFVGEIAGITSAFPGSELTVMFADNAVHNIQYIHSIGELDLDKGFEEGGGGTSFIPSFEMIEEKGLNPNFHAYLTDGYGSFPDKDPGYSCLWIINNESFSIENIPFGRGIRMVD